MSVGRIDGWSGLEHQHLVGRDARLAKQLGGPGGALQHRHNEHVVGHLAVIGDVSHRKTEELAAAFSSKTATNSRPMSRISRNTSSAASPVPKIATCLPRAAAARLRRR